MFKAAQVSPADLVLALKLRADADDSLLKLDLGAGVYRNEFGQYHQYRAIAKAKQLLQQSGLGHDYEYSTGTPEFRALAGQVVFGVESPILSRTCSVQTISGSGSVHLGAALLGHLGRDNGLPKVYYGAPGWNNYLNVFRHVGFEVETLPYYDVQRHELDFEAYLAGVRGAPDNSIMILQGCSQNPTCADLTPDQWRLLAEVMKERGHFPFFDVAYHGLADGLDDDAYSWRHFADMGFEMVVCQSFSKNMGLYGERVGALHVVCSGAHLLPGVESELFRLIRSEYSTNPLFGARLVTIVLSDPELRQDWEAELREMRARLKGLRASLVSKFRELETPGDWSFISREKGLFAVLPLSPDICRELTDKHHIYIVPNGRINISGLKAQAVARFCELIDVAVRRLMTSEVNSANEIARR
ncbi:aspartate aminotransferase [Colletotrichum tabaci]|uniref:Aspartate aminotransferase n=1 Tax=Colletotrichum tabaci TaxID=1209068 RepID=A0AAV9TQB5_9PEZI